MKAVLFTATFIYFAANEVFSSIDRKIIHDDNRVPPEEICLGRDEKDSFLFDMAWYGDGCRLECTVLYQTSIPGFLTDSDRLTVLFNDIPCKRGFTCQVGECVSNSLSTTMAPISRTPRNGTISVNIISALLKKGYHISQPNNVAVEVRLGNSLFRTNSSSNTFNPIFNETFTSSMTSIDSIVLYIKDIKPVFSPTLGAHKTSPQTILNERLNSSIHYYRLPGDIGGILANITWVNAL